MKLNFFSAFHYIIFFGLIILLTPLRMIHQCKRISEYDKNNELKIEKVEQVPVAKENTVEILHSELLFRY